MPGKHEEASCRSTVHCPRCGRFVGHVRGHGSELGLTHVLATCSKHGLVADPTRVCDGQKWGWGWEDFFGGEDVSV